MFGVNGLSSGPDVDAECLSGYFPCSGFWTGNVFLVAIYGYILSRAAKTIADGSELLLDVLHPGVIGGLIIPLLGALPDATIIFVSVAVGSIDEAKEQIHVGMGTLSGSTIMLLTVAWVAGLIAGRCDIVRGKSIDRRLTKKPWDLLGTGVTTLREIRINAIIMIVTILPYLIVETISFVDLGKPLDPVEKESREDDYVMAAFVVTCVFFVSFSVYMVFNTTLQDRRMRAARRKLVLRKLADMFLSSLKNKDMTIDIPEPGATAPASDSTSLLGSTQSTASIQEGAVPKKPDVHELTGRLMRSTSVTDMHAVVSRWKTKQSSAASAQLDAEAAAAKALEGQEEEDEGGERLSKPRLVLKSVILLSVGTAVVVLFSDPMVDTITELADEWHIKNFFISFLVTPFASNASELIASVYFCSKKSSRSSSIAMATVYGAVTMNSTLNLGIFLILMWTRDIYWAFSSEVLPMLFVVVGVGILASVTDTFNMLHALLVSFAYPASLGLVALFQSPWINLDRPPSANLTLTL